MHNKPRIFLGELADPGIKSRPDLRDLRRGIPTDDRLRAILPNQDKLVPVGVLDAIDVDVKLLARRVGEARRLGVAPCCVPVAGAKSDRGVSEEVVDAIQRDAGVEGSGGEVDKTDVVLQEAKRINWRR